MAVTFILGRAGAGKTHRCLSAIAAELARPNEERRLVFLVPEQASFQMERALALGAPRGGYWRAEVLSFSRLARRVFAQTGCEPEVISGATRSLALRLVVAQCRSHLHVLRRASETAGFVAELERLLEQLLREGVRPEDLSAAAAALPNARERTAEKTRDLARIYRAYLDWLGPERIDAAARLELLRARLDALAWLPQASIWVDGFAGFTGQELQTLVELARRAREVFITLLLDLAAPAVRDRRAAPDPLSLFARTEATYQHLCELFDETGVAVVSPICLPPAGLPRFSAAPDLATLEAGLATPWSAGERGASAAHAPPRAVRVLECPTHRDELEAAARWIRTTLADSGGTLRFRDFAVIARDLAPFAELVAEVFAEYEIPYFLDRRRPMRAHPLARFVPALFAVARSDFAVDATVRLLRTRLLPLSRDAAEQIENLVVNHAISGTELWRQPVWELERGRSTQAFAAERLALVTALEPLAAAFARPAETGANWAGLLYRILDDLGVRRRIEHWLADARAARHWESVETHRLAWTALCEVLQDLHDVLGDTLISAAEVDEILTAALADLTLGLAPPAVDQVLVSSIERSRHPEIRHAWVFAFNEGVFPARPAEDVLLSTADRRALADAGLAAPGSHQDDPPAERLLAYIALTRPSRELVVSHAAVGADGAELLSSPLLPELCAALPGLRSERRARSAPPVHLAELAREQLAALADSRRARDRLRYDRLCAQVQTLPALANKLTWHLRGRQYANEPLPVTPYRRPADEPMERVAWRCSPSEVETYLHCPFKHFLRYGVGLDPSCGPQPVRWDLGDIAHKLLAEVTRRAMREPEGVRAIADERWRALLDAAIAEFWAARPADEPQRRPELVFLGRLLERFLRDVIAVHAERWRRGRFEPLGCERPFDPSPVRAPRASGPVRAPRASGGTTGASAASLDARADGAATLARLGVGAVAAADILPALELRLPDGRLIHVRGQIDRIDACTSGRTRLLLAYDYKSKVDRVRGEYLTGHALQISL
ncbi:MAG: PD-(D/E)XK nuclease family protein, partial [Planctomycetota bacterium]